MQGSAQLFIKVDDEDDGEDDIVDVLSIEIDSPQGNVSIGPTIFTGKYNNMEVELDIVLLSDNSTNENITSGMYLSSHRSSSSNIMALHF